MTDVRASEENGVLHLVLDRPAKKNALTGAMYHALSDGLERAQASDTIRAVLISGEGDAFCAGNDVADFLSQGETPVQDSPSVRFIRALARFDKPLLAAVTGNAVGIGTTMLLHCDLVYAAPTARFSTPFSKLGLVPEAGSSLLLPRRIGPMRANAMLLLGETLDAEAALTAGLVNAIMPADALLAHAVAQSSALAALPPAALRASKRLIIGDRYVLTTRIDQELEAFGTALRSDEAKAAFSAFLNRARDLTRRYTAFQGSITTRLTPPEDAGIACGDRISARNGDAGDIEVGHRKPSACASRFDGQAGMGAGGSVIERHYPVHEKG